MANLHLENFVQLQEVLPFSVFALVLNCTYGTRLYLLECMMWGLTVFLISAFFLKNNLGFRQYLHTQALYLFFGLVGGILDALMNSIEKGDFIYSTRIPFFSFTWGAPFTVLCLVFWRNDLKRSFSTVLTVAVVIMLFEHFYGELQSLFGERSTWKYSTNLLQDALRFLNYLVVVDLVTLLAAFRRPKSPTILEVYNTICFTAQVFILVMALWDAEWVNWCRLTTISNMANIVYLFYRSLSDSHQHTQLNDTIRNILIPNSILVAVVYWIGVVTGLPFPREPLWIEIGEHGAFTLIFLVDFAIERKGFPHKIGDLTIKPLIAFHTWYLAFTFLVRYTTGRWVYDLDASMALVMPAAAAAVDLAIMYVWYLLVQVITRETVK